MPLLLFLVSVVLYFMDLYLYAIVGVLLCHTSLSVVYVYNASLINELFHRGQQNGLSGKYIRTVSVIVNIVIVAVSLLIIHTTFINGILPAVWYYMSIGTVIIATVHRTYMITNSFKEDVYD